MQENKPLLRFLPFALLLALSLSPLSAQAPNLLGNADFSAPLSAASPGADGVVDTGGSWTFFLNNGGTGTAALDNGQVNVVPENIQTSPYAIQLIQSPVVLEQTGEYELSFDARSTADRSVVVKIGGTAGRSWAAYSGEKRVPITTTLARYTVKFAMSQPTDLGARVEFWFTEAQAPVWLDNIALVQTKKAVAVKVPVSGTMTKAEEDALLRWELVWSDEFDGKAVDATKWTFEKGNNNGWGNNELQVYTDKPANATLRQVAGASALAVTAVKEPVKDQNKSFSYTSARLVTKNKFTFRYGKVEIRAKMPQGQGIWPAFWMLGDNIDEVGWPACGEIDIMEFLGHDTGTVYSTLHGPITGGPGFGQPYRLPGGASFADDYHVFTFEWHEDHLSFLVDGNLYFLADKAQVQYLKGKKEWVFNRPYFLIVNLAVGGNWPGNPNASTKFPQTLAVDYVRVYENVGSIPEPGQMKWVP